MLFRNEKLNEKSRPARHFQEINKSVIVGNKIQILFSLAFFFKIEPHSRCDLIKIGQGL